MVTGEARCTTCLTSRTSWHNIQPPASGCTHSRAPGALAGLHPPANRVRTASHSSLCPLYIATTSSPTACAGSSCASSTSTGVPRPLLPCSALSSNLGSALTAGAAGCAGDVACCWRCSAAAAPPPSRCMLVGLLPACSCCASCFTAAAAALPPPAAAAGLAGRPLASGCDRGLAAPLSGLSFLAGRSIGAGRSAGAASFFTGRSPTSFLGGRSPVSFLAGRSLPACLAAALSPPPLLARSDLVGLTPPSPSASCLVSLPAAAPGAPPGLPPGRPSGRPLPSPPTRLVAFCCRCTAAGALAAGSSAASSKALLAALLVAPGSGRAFLGGAPLQGASRGGRGVSREAAQHMLWSSTGRL